jgi:hypothetical protein
MFDRRWRHFQTAAIVLSTIALAGCGASGAAQSGGGTATGASNAAASSAGSDGAPGNGATVSASTTPGADTGPQLHPQVVEPTAGVQAQVVGQDPSDPVGDVHAHAPPLTQIRAELRMELVAATANNATYINPLRYVTVWERTDQGVDAQLPVGAPILAPCEVKILAIIPDWYAGQPLVYFELLTGPDAGKMQYVAEEITDIAPAGTILQQGQVIARYAATGTAIEYGWSTADGVTLARATTGYEEGQITPAGRSMRAWLNSLGAKAGPNF